MAKYQVNQIIYYTGDIYNTPGLFKITAVNEPTEFSPTSYDLRELAGDRGFHSVFEIGIKDKYDGTCDYRFVTAKAYDEYIIERHEFILKNRSKHMAKYEN